MRILTVCTSTQVFGAEVITLKLLEGFKLAGHQQIAVTTIWTDGEFNRRLEAIGIQEVQLPFGFLSKVLAWQPIWWTAKVLAHLPILWVGWARLLGEFNPQVILFTTSRQAMLVFPWLSGRPAFLIEHSNLDITPFRKSLYAMLAKRLQGFVGVSEDTGEHLSKFGIPRRMIHVIPNGLFGALDDQSILDKSDELLGGLTLPVIGIVGQILPNKGHHCLIEAVKLLQDEGIMVEVRAFGVGEDNYVSELSEQIDHYGLTKSWMWLGYAFDRATIYPQLDICVMPSFSEAFGLVAVEAAAYGIPVVASCVGGLAEVIIDGQTGFLISPGDARQLAEKIHWLIEHPTSAREMGKSGREHVLARFTLERMVMSFMDMFARAEREKSAEAP